MYPYKALTLILRLTLIALLTVNRPLDQCGKATKSLWQFGETNHHLQVTSNSCGLFKILLLFICSFFHWVRIGTTALSFGFGEIRPQRCLLHQNLQAIWPLVSQAEDHSLISPTQNLVISSFNPVTAQLPISCQPSYHLLVVNIKCTFTR